MVIRCFTGSIRIRIQINQPFHEHMLGVADWKWATMKWSVMLLVLQLNPLLPLVH